jgi:ABC-type lipopolysaccharide export system ATPase subunit
VVETQKFLQIRVSHTRKPLITKNQQILENFLKIRIFRLGPPRAKNEKIFVSDFDDFSVNRLLLSSPTTFVLDSWFNSNVSEIVITDIRTIITRLSSRIVCRYRHVVN